jgi:iron complex outermembrane recepter protein
MAPMWRSDRTGLAAGKRAPLPDTGGPDWRSARLRALLSFVLAGSLAIAFAGTLAAGVPTGPEGRADAEFDFDVPAQPASAALLELARQAGAEVVFSFDSLQRVESNALKGRYRPQDALVLLLKNTGFGPRQTGRGGQKFIVTPDGPATGVLRGSIRSPDGRPAHGVRVILAKTEHSVATNSRGEFVFLSVPAGTYRLMAVAPGFQPLAMPAVRVPANDVATLEAQTLRLTDDPTRLSTFFVREGPTRRSPFDRSETQPGGRTAGSNLDLARTENDPLPFSIYNRDQVARSGVVNLNEFLQREVLDADPRTLPPEQDGRQPTFLAGSTHLNLRGFGVDQTIILVNGRRLPEALINGFDNGQTPELNFIPLSLVQQVEVLPISAASLYSGNAVGGVINIVLRPPVDADATEVTLTYTNALSGYDAPQSAVALLHARSLLGGALQVRLSATLSRATPATEAELGYRRRHATQDLPPAYPLYRATPNVRTLAPDGGPIGGGTLPPLFGTGTAGVTSVAPGADGNGGLAAFAGREGVRNFAFFDTPGGFASSLDSVDYVYGRRQTRAAYFGSVVYDVRPWLQLGLDGTFTRSRFHRGYDLIPADLRLAATSPFNPFGQDVHVSLNETAPALGERYSEARLQFASAVFAALLKLPRDWRVVIDTQFGQNIARYRGIFGADAQRWQALVDQGRYNPLRDTQTFGPPAEFYDRVLIHRGRPGRFVTLGNYSTVDSAFRLSHHALGLPTGTGVLNVGADYRRNELARHTDERRFADDTLAMKPVHYAGRSLERYSLFGELSAPAVPHRWLPRRITEIDIDSAVRHLASNKRKEATLAPTFGLRVRLTGGLALRGSISTSKRYPTPQMSRLVATEAPPEGVVTVGMRPAYDPVLRQTYTVRQDEVFGLELEPESTLTRSAGVVLRRGETHRIRTAIDFVDTEKTAEQIFLDVQTVLNLEHLFPERVVRTPSPGLSARPGSVAAVVTGSINSAWRRSQNWSGSLDYAWTKCLGGTFEAYARLLYFSRYRHLLVRGAPVVDELSRPEGASWNLLRSRARFGSSWSNRSFGVGIDGHYFHSRVLSAIEQSAQGEDRIAPYWQFDGFVQGNIGRWFSWPDNRLRAQLRVNNLFAESYPRYANSGSGAGVQAYGDWRGRMYSLSATVAF